MCSLHKHYTSLFERFPLATIDSKDFYCLQSYWCKNYFTNIAANNAKGLYLFIYFLVCFLFSLYKHKVNMNMSFDDIEHSFLLRT